MWSRKQYRRRIMRHKWLAQTLTRLCYQTKDDRRSAWISFTDNLRRTNANLKELNTALRGMIVSRAGEYKPSVDRTIPHTADIFLADALGITQCPLNESGLRLSSDDVRDLKLMVHYLSEHKDMNLRTENDVNDDFHNKISHCGFDFPFITSEVQIPDNTFAWKLRIFLANYQ